MRKRTVGSWNAAPSLKSSSHTCPSPTSPRSPLISRSSSLRLWSSRTERVPPSISFCLSSKQESFFLLFSSLFVPLSGFAASLATLPPPRSFGPPLYHPLSRSLSSASCLPSVRPFLSSLKLKTRCFPLSLFPFCSVLFFLFL